MVNTYKAEINCNDETKKELIKVLKQAGFRITEQSLCSYDLLIYKGEEKKTT